MKITEYFIRWLRRLSIKKDYRKTMDSLDTSSHLMYMLISAISNDVECEDGTVVSGASSEMTTVGCKISSNAVSNEEVPEISVDEDDYTNMAVELSNAQDSAYISIPVYLNMAFLIYRNKIEPKLKEFDYDTKLAAQFITLAVNIYIASDKSGLMSLSLDEIFDALYNYYKNEKSFEKINDLHKRGQTQIFEFVSYMYS